MLIDAPTGADPLVDSNQFAERTGWELKPEGACKGSVCVPMPDDVKSGDQLNVAVLAEKLGMPLLRDGASDTGADPSRHGHRQVIFVVVATRHQGCHYLLGAMVRLQR
jgi:hypothetical protein